ncbi:MAG: hypothetical protein QF511_02745 [Rhodospirillales bacterium]|nr:hypothetical protein [Rhodospirillales bacterium]
MQVERRIFGETPRGSTVLHLADEGDTATLPKTLGTAAADWDGRLHV